MSETRIRWLGHRLRAEVNIAVDPTLSVAEAHHIAIDVEDRLLKQVGFLSHATIHVDPLDASGDTHHHLSESERPL